MRFPIVMIAWCDAMHLEHGWMDVEDVPGVKHEDDRCRTVGWVVRVNEQSITLAQTDGIGSLANTVQIPVGMIKSITLLTPPNE